MSTMPTMRTAYNLIKYSRVTPRESQSGRGLELDWHHCTEPVLRLLLEIRRTPSGIPDSTRMRVVWTRVSNGTSHENTVLEDIDVAALQKHSSQLAVQGTVPLKVVYKDNTLGLRYYQMSSDPFSQVQRLQRRFQITFVTHENTTEVINAIKEVCPVRQSGHNVQFSQVGTQLDASIPPLPLELTTTNLPQTLDDGFSFLPFTSSSSQILSDSLILNTPGVPRRPTALSTPSGPPADPASAGSSSIKTIIATQQGVATSTTSVASPACRMNVNSVTDLPALPSPPQTCNNSNVESHHDRQVGVSVPPPPSLPQHVSSDDCLPPSSAVPSSDTGSSLTATVVDNELLSSAFKDLTGTGVSNHQLETVIAQIICDDDFVKLLEDVDKLWRLKALIT